MCMGFFVKATILNCCSLFVSPVAQHGESLLWSSWLDKSETPLSDGGGRASAPWDDSKLEWDKHVAETYYSYWEQYSYWVGQGWTVDLSGSTANNNEAEAASVVTGRSSEIKPEQWRDGVGRQAKAARDDVEVLNQVFGENCTLEPSEKGEVCGSDPQDGGNQRDRAASSSQHNNPQQPGNVCLGSLICRGKFAKFILFFFFFCGCKGFL